MTKLPAPGHLSHRQAGNQHRGKTQLWAGDLGSFGNRTSECCRDQAEPLHRGKGRGSKEQMPGPTTQLCLHPAAARAGQPSSLGTMGAAQTLQPHLNSHVGIKVDCSSNLKSTDFCLSLQGLK